MVQSTSPDGLRYREDGDTPDIPEATESLAQDVQAALNALRTLITQRLVTTPYSGTTDSAGFVTVPHGAPFTPSAVLFTSTDPAGKHAVAWGYDNLSSSNVRLRFMHELNGGAYASAAVSGVLVAFK